MPESVLLTGLRGDGDGADAIMANTPLGNARDVATMAGAFGKAVEAGKNCVSRRAWQNSHDGGVASSPLTGFL